MQYIYKFNVFNIKWETNGPEKAKVKLNLSMTLDEVLESEGKIMELIADELDETYEDRCIEFNIEKEATVIPERINNLLEDVFAEIKKNKA